MSVRIGHGYDVHRLTEGRHLVLGGVDIPFELGLDGHSDADVLLHAICDALLGAAAMRDIGYHFPDSDSKYEGVSSLLLLDSVYKMLQREGYYILNIDATVIAQRPKLRPYIETMIDNIAKCLHLDRSCINVKATTEERLGFTGRGEGISAHAVCLIEK